MRVIAQRVSSASVTVAGEVVGQIGPGLLLLVGISPSTTAVTLEKAVQKIIKCRIFADERGQMNRSIQDINGGLLVVSQFTLFADTQKGNRPSFTSAAPPVMAKEMYERLVHMFKEVMPNHVQQGVFGADMQVALINDGPVTIPFEFV